MPWQRGGTTVEIVHADFPHTAYRWLLETRKCNQGTLNCRGPERGGGGARHVAVARVILSREVGPGVDGEVWCSPTDVLRLDPRRLRNDRYRHRIEGLCTGAGVDFPALGMAGIAARVCDVLRLVVWGGTV
jgi:hypothetical protein